MFIRFDLQNALRRRIFLLVCVVSCGVLVRDGIGEFVVGTLSDKRVAVKKDLLRAAGEYFPSSARLAARLAESQTMEPEVDWTAAEKNVRQAIKLSPHDYQYRLLLAQIKDASGASVEAEAAFDDAVRMAPNYGEVHWQLANFLVRENRVEDASEHFRRAAASNPALFPSALALVWAASDKNIPLLKRIVGDNPQAQLKLALLLSENARPGEAAEIFAKIDGGVALSRWESSAIFDSLIGQGLPGLAGQLWNRARSATCENAVCPPLWNGDFESANDSDATQFDWRIGRSDYARIGFDGSVAHTGTRSLRIDFLGRDTTRLENEIKHLVALRPATVYQLEFYARTEELKTAEGPRVHVSDASGNRVAESEPIAAGTADWKRFSIKFTAPPKVAGDDAALFVSVRRQPRYGFDEPTRGRIWFDDFTLREVDAK